MLPSVAAVLAHHARAGRPGADGALDGRPLPPAEAVAVPLPGAGAVRPVRVPGAMTEGEQWRRLAELSAEVRTLRARLRTHPLVARAQGVLQERYRLADERAAFRLLETAAQDFGLRLRPLAAAVLAAPRPEGPGPWFPGRGRVPAPRLDFLPGLPPERTDRSEVVTAVLGRVLEIAQTGMGNVQLVDPASGDLQMKRHRGLHQDFVEFFDQVGRDGTSCALAAEQVARVTVTDVATDAVFSEPARQMILSAGSRSCHSTPLLASDGRCVGMVSSHHESPGHILTARQAGELDEIGSQAGQWLRWHHETVVLDALEHLHHLATRPAGHGGPATG